MFLRQVFRHSKWMFAGMVFFALLQLVVNYKKGMVFSPFYHYGMYSQKVKAQKEFVVHHVIIHGDTLRAADYTPPQWDKIQVTLQQVLASRCDSSFYTHQVARLFAKAGWRKPQAGLYTNTGTMPQKLNAYKQWVMDQTGKYGAPVDILPVRYRYFYGRFKIIGMDDSLSATNHLCN